MKNFNLQRTEVAVVCLVLGVSGVYLGLRPSSDQVAREKVEREFNEKLATQPLRAPATETKAEPLLHNPMMEVEPFKAPRRQDLMETLSEYKSLGRKVLMSEMERARVQEILEDPGFIRGLGEILKSRTAGLEPEARVDAAKLLLEALRYSESSAAETVLTELISDKAVEDPGVPMAERESLAETKAEIMYVWSSRDFSAVSKIEASLPGTVSQNIWNNVKSLQTQNAVESTALAHKFAQTGSHYREPAETEN